MNTETKIHIEGLLAYIMRTDARIIALQLVLGDMLKLTEGQKREFAKAIEQRFKILYEKMLELSESVDPGLAARLRDGQNP